MEGVIGTTTNNEVNKRSASPLMVGEKEAAVILSSSVSALQKWRINSNGPPFLILGKRSVKYLVSDLYDVIQSRKVMSTTEWSEKQRLMSQKNPQTSTPQIKES